MTDVEKLIARLDKPIEYNSPIGLALGEVLRQRAEAAAMLRSLAAEKAKATLALEQIGAGCDNKAIGNIDFRRLVGHRVRAALSDTVADNAGPRRDTEASSLVAAPETDGAYPSSCSNSPEPVAPPAGDETNHAKNSALSADIPTCFDPSPSPAIGDVEKLIEAWDTASRADARMTVASQSAGDDMIKALRKCEADLKAAREEISRLKNIDEWVDNELGKITLLECRINDRDAEISRQRETIRRMRDAASALIAALPWRN